MATLIKIDRNGSKHYEGMVTCDRCGGKGGADQWNYTGWTCYKCGGTGKIFSTWIERTPEYEAKLAERRRKAHAKKEAELEAKRIAEYDKNCADTLVREGFSPDGISYLFLGDTYNDRDAIKEAGGKFNYKLGWHIDHEIDGFRFLKIKFEDYADFNAWGRADVKLETDFEALKRDELNRLNGMKPSEYIGNIGDKITAVCTYEHTAWYNWHDPFGRPTTRYIHSFKDTVGNVFVWNTGTYGDLSSDHIGHRFELKAIVKDHSEYDGEKQTIVKNCRIKWLEEVKTA